MTKILFLLFFTILITSCNNNEKDSTVVDDFSFVFMTDIHLDTTTVSQNGFQRAIDTINNLDVDFVVTGGDLFMDANKATFEQSEKLFSLYKEMSSLLEVPVYNTIGNHDNFGISDSANIKNPLYGDEMFKNKITDPYYYFEHEGCHFFILNSISIDIKEQYKFIGYIDSAQTEFIKNKLQKIDTLSPIVLVSHIPFLTVWTEISYNPLQANFKGIVVINGNEVLKLFENYNLKLVLQGHLHYLENIEVFGIDFLTGGSVCGEWWKGPEMKTEEGFLKIDVKDNNFSWKYVDLEWSPE